MLGQVAAFLPSQLLAALGQSLGQLRFQHPDAVRQFQAPPRRDPAGAERRPRRSGLLPPDGHVLQQPAGIAGQKIDDGLPGRVASGGRRQGLEDGVDRRRELRRPRNGRVLAQFVEEQVEQPLEMRLLTAALGEVRLQNGFELGRFERIDPLQVLKAVEHLRGGHAQTGGPRAGHEPEKKGHHLDS
jgi:hypothetical protein